MNERSLRRRCKESCKKKFCQNCGRCLRNGCPYRCDCKAPPTRREQRMGIDLANVIGARRVRTPAPLYRTPNSGTLLHSAESAVETPQHAEQVSGPDFFAPEDSVLTGSELDLHSWILTMSSKLANVRKRTTAKSKGSSKKLPN